MDLPIPRIKNTELQQQSDKQIVIYDNGYSTALLRFTDNVAEGDYVALITFKDATGRPYTKLMKMVSTYVYANLNRRTLITELISKFDEYNLAIDGLGVFYAHSKGHMVGHKAVTVRRKDDTNELFVNNPKGDL